VADTPKNSRRGACPSAASGTPCGPHTVFSLSEEETYEFGRAVGQQLQAGDLVLLQGELGLGKTVFARGVAAGLGVCPDEVSSPSYTLVHEYRGGRLPLFHIDLYRIDDPAELTTLGLDEILACDAVAIVEWGERLPPFYRRGAISVRFLDIGEGSRRIEVRSPREEPSSDEGDA
jgi:tRNA threonylcarbamoyladenosine biosynthesis protein TsaE